MRSAAAAAALLGAAALLAAAAAADVPMRVQVHEDPATAAGTTFFYHGSIQNVISGRVPPDALVELDPEDVYYGFSVGGRGNLTTMGNMVVLNGFVHNRDTNLSSPTYYDVVAGAGPYISTSSVYLKSDAVPVASVSIRDARTEYTDVTKAIYDLAGGRPHCYVGLATFHQLQGVALTKSPVYGQSIFKNKPEYFAEPPCCLNATAPSPSRPVPATLMGCAADLRDEKNGTLKELLERVLYVNPFGVAEELTVHVEVMQLRREVGTISAIVPGDGVAIDHMLSQSVLASLEASVYVVGDLQPLVPAS